MKTSESSKKSIISVEIIKQFESEIEDIIHGSGILQIYIRDGRLHRYTVNREKSYIPNNGVKDNG